jgi:glycosidase
MSIAGGDVASVDLATLLVLTYPGAPSIYYGDEVGLPGAIDPDSRRGFPLEANWNREILNTHRELIALRHSYPCLRIGDYRVLYAQGALYVFARTLGTEELIIAVNVGTAEAKANLESVNLQSQPDKLLFGTAEVEWNVEKEKQLSLTLAPRSACILGVG